MAYPAASRSLQQLCFGRTSPSARSCYRQSRSFRFDNERLAAIHTSSSHKLAAGASSRSVDHASIKDDPHPSPSAYTSGPSAPPLVPPDMTSRSGQAQLAFQTGRSSSSAMQNRFSAWRSSLTRRRRYIAEEAEKQITSLGFRINKVTGYNEVERLKERVVKRGELAQIPSC